MLPVTPSAPIRAKFKHILSVLSNIRDNLGPKALLVVLFMPSSPCLPPPLPCVYRRPWFLTLGISSCFCDFLGEAGGSAILRHWLECMALVLQHQHTGAATWDSSDHLQAFQLIMLHFDDCRPKVRRASHQVTYP